jgi:hypothetical protein
MFNNYKGITEKLFEQRNKNCEKSTEDRCISSLNYTLKHVQNISERINWLGAISLKTKFANELLGMMSQVDV